MYIPTLRQAWKIVIAVFGFTVLLIGLALLVLPGPGILIIFLGLAILAGQFLWARWLLRRAKHEFKRGAIFARKTFSEKNRKV